MKYIIISSLIMVSIFDMACADLDGFLFNPKEIESYELPDNDIPEAFLTQVTFESNGNTLYGYWVASEGGRPGITILYCHGNKHNIDEYWDRIMYLHDMGVNVFIFDYSGYGLSEGTNSEESLLANGDAALDYVLSRSEVTADSLVLYGYSLGNVVSIYLAAEKINPLVLIAEAPFASANSLTQGSLLIDVPSLWLTGSNFDNGERIKEINTPFLLLHGDKDDLIRYEDNGRYVFENAPDPKSRVVVEGAKHTNIPEILGVSTYLSILIEWINEVANQ